MVESTPPPLPSSLSSRLQSSVHPQTGQCKFHPTVQLCELVQNNTRWVVRRKICYKCGSRPKGSGKHHMPGRCVSHVSKESKLIGERTETLQRGRQLRRSSSLLRSNSRSSSRSTSVRASSQSYADGGKGRGRSVSATRMTRSASVGASRRERLNSSSRNVVRRSSSLSRERADSSVGDVRKKEGDKLKSNNHRGTENNTAVRIIEKVKTKDEADVTARSKENETSYHDRALEFTQNAMEISEEKGYSQAIVPMKKADDNLEESAEDFDESDPIIMIPSIHLGDASLPPPPPRTPEEMNIYEYRQELRRQHIRQQRRESSKSRSKLNATSVERQTEEKKSNGTRQLSTVKKNSSEGLATAPTRELRKSRRDWNKQSESKPRKRPDSPTPVSAAPVHPSLAVLTALENHRQKIEDKEHENNPSASTDEERRRRKINHQEKMVKIQSNGRDHIDEDAESETSSISTASAKQYQLQPEPTNELRACHPELKGGVSNAHKFPPVNVTVDRSRSRSKSRTKMRVAVDPVDAPEEKEMKITVYDKTGSRRLSGSGVKKHSSEMGVDKKSSRKQDNAAGDTKNVTKRLSKTSASSQPRPTQKTHASSSAQASKRLSRSYSGRVRDVEGRDVSSGNRASRSAERSPSLAVEGKQRRSKSSATSKGGVSRHTSVTQPESLSSDEFLRKGSIKAEPVVLRKKSATRRSRKDDSNDDDYPVTAIRISEDEKSHASSISAGSRSTLEESFHSDDKGGGEEAPAADTRKKATKVLKDVKGGAKSFAGKGKSALDGLKGTSKKWQSALFM